MAEKALCYVRVSTEEQKRKQNSIEAQIAKLQAWCQLNEVEAEIVRDEAVSGATDLQRRTGGRYLVERVSKVKTVVVCKLDRIFRDSADCLVKTKQWQRQDVRFIVLDLGVDTSTPIGRFFLSMISAFAELERNQCAARTKDVLEYRKSQGKAYSPTPFGMDRCGEDLVSNPEEEAIIERIREMRARRLSFGKIAARLNEEGIPTKQGKKWHPYTVSYILKRLDKAA